MKQEKEKHTKSLKDYIEGVSNPIFNKVLSESNNNPMVVGRVQEKQVIKWLWQPHNYRLMFNFSKKSYKPVTTLPLYKYPTFKFKSLNYDSEHHYINFKGCRIIIRKNSAEVINKSYGKQWVLCVAYSQAQIKEVIDKRVNRLNQEGINALNSLIKRTGGISDLKIKSIRGEHGVHGIEYLDKIPEDMIIHDTIFKKVYKKKIEFYDPTYVKNVVSNSALKDFSPEIANSMENIAESINKFGAMLSGNLNMMAMLTNQNLEITKLRRDVTKIQRKKKPINNKDLRKWL